MCFCFHTAILRHFSITPNKNKKPGVTIRGLFIINHDFEKPDIEKRNKRPFDNTRENDAKNDGYGIASAIEMLEGYILLKSGKITLEQFARKVFLTAGIISFQK